MVFGYCLVLMLMYSTLRNNRCQCMGNVTTVVMCSRYVPTQACLQVFCLTETEKLQIITAVCATR